MEIDKVLSTGYTWIRSDRPFIPINWQREGRLSYTKEVGESEAGRLQDRQAKQDSIPVVIGSLGCFRILEDERIKYCLLLFERDNVTQTRFFLEGSNLRCSFR